MRIERRKAEPIKETQMISLADIAFLIIFFFMLTSTFMRDRLAVALPRLAHTTKTNSPITVVVDKDAKVYLNGQEVGGADVLEREIKSLLADRSTPTEMEVRLNCEKTLPFKSYSGVYRAISRAGGVIAIRHDVK